MIDQKVQELSAAARALRPGKEFRISIEVQSDGSFQTKTVWKRVRRKAMPNPAQTSPLDM